MYDDLNRKKRAYEYLELDEQQVEVHTIIENKTLEINVVGKHSFWLRVAQGN